MNQSNKTTLGHLRSVLSTLVDHASLDPVTQDIWDSARRHVENELPNDLRDDATKYTVDPAWLAALHKRGPIRITCGTYGNTHDYIAIIKQKGLWLAAPTSTSIDKAIACAVSDVRRKWRTEWPDDVLVINAANLPRESVWLTRDTGTHPDANHVCSWSKPPKAVDGVFKGSFNLMPHARSFTLDECFARFGFIPEPGGSPVEVEVIRGFVGFVKKSDDPAPRQLDRLVRVDDNLIDLFDSIGWKISMSRDSCYARYGAVPERAGDELYLDSAGKVIEAVKCGW